MQVIQVDECTVHLCSSKHTRINIFSRITKVYIPFNIGQSWVEMGGKGNKNLNNPPSKENEKP